MASLGEWVHERERRMQLVFSASDVRALFPEKNIQVLRNGLNRLCRSGRLEIVHRGIYVIVPPKYEGRGGMPPMFYMDSMMKLLKRDYYFGLLTAARMWGASHQLSQVDSVVTVLPNMSTTVGRNAQVAWCYRKAIPTKFVCEVKGEYDRVRYSNAELTALDLIQYATHAGGLSRVASVLSELIERTDFSSCDETGLLDVPTIPTIQRLGYLLEDVIGDSKNADALYAAFERRFRRRHKLVPLDVHADADGAIRNERWRVLINREIEVDDL